MVDVIELFTRLPGCAERTAVPVPVSVPLLVGPSRGEGHAPARPAPPNPALRAGLGGEQR